MSDRRMVPEFLLQPGAHALCAETDPEVWFPEQGQSNATAKAVCAQCDLRDPCLAYALKHTVFGVWGGTGENERRRIKEAKPPRPVSTLRRTRINDDVRTRVLDMTNRGWTPTQIARELGISVRSAIRIRAQAGDAA